MQIQISHTMPTENKEMTEQTMEVRRARQEVEDEGDQRGTKPNEENRRKEEDQGLEKNQMEKEPP